MRVRVGFARPTMRGPARVSDAGRAVELLAFDGARQVVELAHRAHKTQATPVVHRQTRRIVAAVFQLAQPLEQNGSCPIRTNVANDSAHAPLSAITGANWPIFL